MSFRVSGLRDELIEVLSGMGLRGGALDDCEKFVAGEPGLELVEGLPAIELNKLPADVQGRVHSLFLDLLRNDRPSAGRFLRLCHRIGGVTLLFVLYRERGGFRDEFNELSSHAFLQLDMVRWIAYLASICQLRYIRPYAATFLDRLFRESPEVLHAAARQSSPAGQIYLASYLIARDPVKYVKTREWLDESLVIVTMAYLFQDCGLTDGERDVIKRFLAGDEAVTSEVLETGLKPEVRKRIYRDISRLILNGLYYCCSMVETHSKVAKRFIQLIALIDFSLTLETSDVVRDERGYFWMMDRQVHSVDNGKDAILDADFDSFEVLSMYFARDRSSAFMLAQKLDGSDPGTFEVIGAFDSQFARDRSSVYWHGRTIEGADPTTFKVLGGYHCYWAKDAHKAYCFYGDKAAPKIINTKDPGKFELIPDSYWTEHARDGKYVYYYGRRMKNANPATFRSMPCERFGGKDLGCDYYTDDARIFYKGWEVTEADLDSFMVYWLPGLGHSPYGVDRNNAYYHGKPLPPVQAIDIMKTARQHPQFAEKIGEGAIRRMEEWDRTGKRPDGKVETVAGKSDYSRIKVEILEWGEFQVDRTEGSAGKTVSVLDGFKLKRRSSRIPAVKGISFGINHVSRGNTSPVINNLTIRLLHPPIRNPADGLVKEKTEWDIPVGLKVLSHNSHTFDEDWEIVEGRWVFQVIHDEAVLAEKAFQVRKPVEIPVTPGLPVIATEVNASSVLCLAVTSDGRYAVSGCVDATIKLWDLGNGRVIRTFQGHTDRVISVAISPDGKQVLSGSNDRSVRLWDMENGKEIAIFQGHKKELNAVAFSSDGRFALSAGEDETIRLWNIKSGKEIKKFGRHMAVDAITFSPDNRSILSGGFHLKLWDLESGELTRDIKIRSGGVNLVTSLVYAGEGGQVLTGNTDHTMNLCDLETGKVAITFPGHTDVVLAVAISPDGRRALSGSLDKTIRLWDLESTEEIRMFSGHMGGVKSVHFLSDGKMALSGGLDGTIRLWDVETGEEKTRLASPEDGINP